MYNQITEKEATLLHLKTLQIQTVIILVEDLLHLRKYILNTGVNRALVFTPDTICFFADENNIY